MFTRKKIDKYTFLYETLTKTIQIKVNLCMPKVKFDLNEVLRYLAVLFLS